MYAPGPFPLRQEPRDLRLQLAALSRAVSENRLDARLKIYTVPRLLIVDEICYLPIDRTSPRRLSPTNKYESGALSALFAIGQWRVSSRLYCRQTEEWWGLTGPKGRHEPTRTHHHWGATPRQLTFGGRQLSLSCPRVRSREGQEAALPSVRAFREKSPP